VIGFSRSRNYIRGFTLIELLVVIAIIGILAGIVLASLGAARDHTRDTKRIAELRQIQNALQVFYNVNGRYPTQGAPDLANGTICAGCTAGINAILQQYMGGVPTDPLNDATHYYYYDGSHGCGGLPNQAAAYAVNLEARTGNSADLCNGAWDGEGNPSGTVNRYNVLFGTSSG